MNLESKKITVSKNAETLFGLLSNIENFEKLMPESISKFEVLNENSFLFALKGMPEIALEKKGSTPHSQLVLGAKSDKIPFTLTANLQEINPTETEVQLSFEGSFNPMMAMMIKAPISKFIETLADKMPEL
ncbi:MAG: SRPBCC family protein [Capnocytophaga sp.]|nr:SRPBCC family protein [Capnocytophaga sp.]